MDELLLPQNGLNQNPSGGGASDAALDEELDLFVGFAFSDLGQHVSFVFLQAGTYTYRSALRPTMSGRVVVHP